MPRIYRRYIFFLFLGVFALTAPLLILYTAGYRYNWERRKIQETGVLLTNYRPTDALLQLNNIMHTKKAPVRFAGLIPGRYTIAIEKEGYHTWQKRIWVEPSKTTFAEHMILWKKNIVPERIINDALTIAAPSSNKKYIAFVTKNDSTRIALFDTRTKKIVETVAPSLKKLSAITTLLWSPNARRLFIESENGEQFIATIGGEQSALAPLAPLSGERLLRVTWNTDDDDRLYGYRRSAPLKQGYELLEVDFFRGATQTASVGVLPNAFPYFVEDDLFYRVEKGVLSITSFITSKQALERRLALPDAPTNKVTVIADGPDNIITLFDEEHKRLLLIDKGTATLYPIQETIDGVISAVWSPQKNRLLWNTGKTLGLLDLERSAREIIVEEDKKIHAMAWNPENEYIFYGAGDAVTVTEIDNRDVRNRVTLTTIKDSKGMTVDQTGNMLFVQERNGFSSLSITDR